MTDAGDGRRLRVLIVHNAYQHRGGEDAVVDAEAALLTANGHEVAQLTRHNDAIKTMNRAQAALEAIWSARSAADFQQQVASFRPDVVHVHNSFPLLSPSIYWAADRIGVPVVQTLHNFRLICPQAMLLRERQICEDCVGRVPWRAAVHGCYRGSRVQSAVVASMLQVHRAAGTWRDKVTLYIALNEFCKQKFVDGGLPAERLRVKPNFVDLDPPPPQHREGFLFVGRLSIEKGLEVLAEAMSRAASDVELRVAGSGPQQDALRGALRTELLGPQPPSEVYRLMARSTALVLPSICYESFPRTVVEAYANALPVIASRTGPLVDLIRDGRTGLLFEAGDAAELAAKMAWAQNHPAEMATMGLEAQRLYRTELTGRVNHRQLLSIYDEAIASRRSDQTPMP